MPGHISYSAGRRSKEPGAAGAAGAAQAETGTGDLVIYIFEMVLGWFWDGFWMIVTSWRRNHPASSN